MKQLLLCVCALAMTHIALAAAPKLSPEQQQAADKLQAKGALVMSEAANEPGLVVSLGLLGKQAGDADLTLVKALPEVVELNLAGSGITDGGLANIAGMAALRRLRLERTAITDAGLTHLKNLAALESLNLYGTAVTDKGMAELAGLKKLQKLFLWQTKVTDAGVSQVKQAIPNLVVNRGEEAATLMAVKAEEARKAEEAKKAAASTAKPVNDKCPLTGKPVDPKFTFVYEGKTIAFCCGDCCKTFAANPKEHIAKVVTVTRPAAVVPAAKVAPEPVNDKCPLTGRPVDAKFTFVYEGKTIGFCCGDCCKKFAENPKEHIARVITVTKAPPAPAAAPAPKGAARPVNDKCPVSGEPVDPKITFVYEGRTIGFCCNDCCGKFAKNPKEYIAKVAEVKK